MKVSNENDLLEMYMGLFPYEECKVKSLTFFIPLEVKYITDLDRIFERIIYNTKGIRFRDAYKSIIPDYSKLNLNRLSWKRVFSINYSQINPNIDFFSLRLFRLTESLLFFQIDFELSDLVKYQFWQIITKKYEGKEIKKKHYKEIHHNDSVQRMAIDAFLISIEKECKKVINSYFGKYFFFDNEYHYPCIRTYLYHKIDERTEYIDSFWMNMGIDDRYPNHYLTNDNLYLLRQDYEKNTLSIFANYRNIKYQEMYQNIENQITYEMDEIVASFGPSIAISEIYNYLYLKYRLITKKKNYFLNARNALKLTNLLIYIYEFSKEIISEDIFVFHKVDFFLNESLTKKTYIDNVKHVLIQKKKILDGIYEKENRVFINAINFTQAIFNHKMQVVMFICTILAIITGAIVTIVASS